jgi:hypothetical protein
VLLLQSLRHPTGRGRGGAVVDFAKTHGPQPARQSPNVKAIIHPGPDMTCNHIVLQRMCLLMPLIDWPGSSRLQPNISIRVAFREFPTSIAMLKNLLIDDYFEMINRVSRGLPVLIKPMLFLRRESLMRYGRTRSDPRNRLKKL